MTQRRFVVGRVLLVCLGGLAVLGARESQMPDAARLLAMTARYAPVDIGADLSSLPAHEREALTKLVAAGRVMDALFLRQVWGGNEALLVDLLADPSPLGRARLHYYLINKGPWSRLDHNSPFVPGIPAKPEGGHFYPAGASKADVEAWVATLPAADRAAAQGFFTRDRSGSC